MKIYKIGTTAYVVAKSFEDREHIGARALPVKIVGYQNIGHKIHPILKNGAKEVSPELNHIFYDLESAIEKIKSKK